MNINPLISKLKEKFDPKDVLNEDLTYIGT